MNIIISALTTDKLEFPLGSIEYGRTEARTSAQGYTMSYYLGPRLRYILCRAVCDSGISAAFPFILFASVLT